MTYPIGKPFAAATILLLNDAEVATGSATVRYWKDPAGTPLYLQSDETTWSASLNTFPAPHGASEGFAELDVLAPASADGEVVNWVIEHSVYGDIGSGEGLVGSTGGGGGGGGGSGLDVDLVP